jgi:phosphoribosylformimino-5-aminoimidazole carboxamide ribotide isomerase
VFERFTVIPAIDLKDGRVVRLLRGDMAHATVYDDDPAAVAARFESAGATLIHVVDLDGAIAGAPRNLDAIRAIRAAVRCEIDLGGGLRTLESIRAALAAGADRVSIGSAAFLDPALLRAACGEFPGRIFGALDARAGRLAIKGWVETTALTVEEAAQRFRDVGAAAVTVTDIGRDGTETGVDATRMAEVARAGGLPTIASGGVATLTDIAQLKARFNDGVVGVVVGRALYEGRFELSQALAIAR